MTSHIFKSPLPDVDLSQQALTSYTFRDIDQHRDKIALINGATGSSYTYAELIDAIHRLAGGLRQAGFAEGSTLALIAPNVPEFAIVFHATAVCAATVTTVNPVYGVEEIRQQFLDSGATLAFTVSAAAETVAKAAVGTGVSALYLLDEDVLDETPSAAATVGAAANPPGSSITTSHWRELLADPLPQTELDARRNVVVLPYSSGTTGIPKGVMLSHSNLVANIIQTNTAQKYQQDEIALAVLPFFHIYGMQVLMNCFLAEGLTVVTLPRFDMEQVLSLIQQHKVTRFFAVPPIILGFAKHPAVENYNLSSLRQIFSGAAPLGAELASEASNRLGCKVVQGYGMTEMSPVSHLSAPDHFKPGASGITVCNTESRIVDTNGNDLGPDEVGELWVRGPQVMLGYLNNPDATAETLDDDGWLHTGDLACIDEDGQMTIVDRLKELIKYKGFQVAPAELEALIVSHPAIADVAVIGIADEEAGEVPKAYVCLKPDQTLAADELQAYVAGHVASYKQIRQVEFVDSIPKSASGKILRRLLREPAT